MAMERGDRKESRSDTVMGCLVRVQRDAIAECCRRPQTRIRPGLTTKDTRPPFIRQDENSYLFIILSYLLPIAATRSVRAAGAARPSSQLFAASSVKSRKLSTAGERDARSRTKMAIRQVTVGWRTGRKTSPNPSTSDRAIEGH